MVLMKNLSIDNSKHSPFGVSKVSGDLLVQEYGKYFGLNTSLLESWLFDWRKSCRSRTAWFFVLFI